MENCEGAAVCVEPKACEEEPKLDDEPKACDEPWAEFGPLPVVLPGSGAGG